MFELFEDVWRDESTALVFETFGVVLLTFVLAFAFSRFLTSLSKKADKTNNPWDGALVSSIQVPGRWFIWLIGLSYAAEVVASGAHEGLLLFVPGVRQVGVIVILTWALVGFVSQAEKIMIMPSPDGGVGVDKTTAMAIGKLLRISIIVTAALVLMQSLGYSISGVLAFGGIGGIAVGFAAKDLLANFFGGLMIYLDRPFAVGDWIRSPDKDIEGTVEDIGWRLTRIRTFDKRPLYVPNATFTQISVENPSRMTHRRIYENLGVRYADAGVMSQIIDGVKEMIEQHPDLDQSQTIIVNLNKFAPSSLEFFVYCFTKTTNWVEFHKVKQNVMLKIIEIIRSYGAECAFPTTTMHIADAIQVDTQISSAVEAQS